MSKKILRITDLILTVKIISFSFIKKMKNEAY